MRANPFVITFDDDADGGPEHLLSLLEGYGVRLVKDGEIVAEGILGKQRYGNTTAFLTLHAFEGETFFPFYPHAEKVWEFPIYGEVFDEIRYL
jgi:hypothetical protein